MHNMKVRLIDP